MFAVLHATAIVIANLFKSRRRLEAENALLRHQLSIALRRRAPPRLRLSGMDRAILAWMVRLWPDLIGTVQVVKPETILRWYRAGFRAFWRWKSRKRAGRPKIDRGLRDLVRWMSLENPLWGVSRIVSLAANPCGVRRLLQSGTPTPGFAKGCAIKTSRAADRQFQFSAGCIINMSGYNFRKGQQPVSLPTRAAAAIQEGQCTPH